MLKIEFIYDQDCPNVKETKSNLFKAIEKNGAEYKFLEWDRSSDKSPEYAKTYGSPTILINQNDILEMQEKSTSNCCRIYGNSGVPSIEFVSNAIIKELKKEKNMKSCEHGHHHCDHHKMPMKKKDPASI